MKVLLALALIVVAEAGVARRQVLVHPTVIDGVDSDIADYPFQLSLLFGGSHTCGASVLSANKALTAAHCTINRETSAFSVRAGSSTHLSGGQVVNVASVVEHPDYQNFGAYPNDVCVVTLSGSLDLGDSNVALTVLDPTNAGDRVGDICKISGWGRDESGDLPDILQSRDMQVISNAECSSYSGGIEDGHICIMSTDGLGSACSGDSGGPLTCNGNQAGVTSWVFGNCATDMPNGYARVAYFNDWISSEM
uniref:Putative chymotrypsinogen n=1 Tax=Pectinaria gouldii TaxID=260746 RepID=A0A0K1R005_PECGU|nr:putative chymotrypsinogen [Pectinaria gouldii]